MRELRIELSRRSLEVCHHTDEGSASAPTAVVTLLSNDLDRVSYRSFSSARRRWLSVGARFDWVRSPKMRALSPSPRQSTKRCAECSGPRTPPPAPARHPGNPPPPRVEKRRQGGLTSPRRGAPLRPLKLAVSIGPMPECCTDQVHRRQQNGARPRGRAARGGHRFALRGIDRCPLGPFDRSGVRLGVDFSISCPGRCFISLWFFGPRQFQARFDAGAVLALLREEYAPVHRAHQEVEVGARGA